MLNSRNLLPAIAVLAFASAPGQAQLLGGGLGGSLGGTLNSTLGNGPVAGSGAGSLGSAVNGTLSANRSIDPRSGRVNADAGLAGSVNSVASGGIGTTAIGKDIGLAGSSSVEGSGSANGSASAKLIGTDQLAGSVDAIRGRAASTAANAGERASTVAGNVRDRAAGTTRSLQDRAGNMAGKASGSVNLAGSIEGSAQAE